ncbi:MAG TPA: hypothetical protein VM580_25970 [Labilithrix sp.]|jgi:hypothetical protein|nr:hypothetical protein [Labilithrix sp.]
MAKRTTSEAAKPDDDPLVVSERVLSERIAKKAKEKDVDDRELTRLTRSLVAIREAMRAAEKQAAKNTNAITPAMLADWVKRSTKAERDQLRRDLDAADRQQRGGGVFG